MPVWKKISNGNLDPVLCRFDKDCQPLNSIIDAFAHRLHVQVQNTIDTNTCYFVGGPIFCLEQLQHLRDRSACFINIDKGYFSNKKSTSHWRVSFNELQNTRVLQVPDDRWQAFGIELQPPRRDGSYILILAPSVNPLKYHTEYDDPLAWALTIKNQLLQFTTRKIFIRFKDNVKKGVDPLIKYLQDCWAVVSLQSVGAVQALIHGVPAINLASSCLDSLSIEKNLENIDTVQCPQDRYHWLCGLAYSQFTTEEIRSGQALNLIAQYHGRDLVALGKQQ